MSVDDLQDRLVRLESIQEIQVLKNLYATYWNFGWEAAGESGEKLAQLFTEDGIIDFGDFGRAHGRGEIAAMANGWAAAGRQAADGTPRPHPGLSVHYVANPRIDVSGGQASGVWAGIIAATVEGTPAWVAGQYTDTFMRRPEGWLIRSVLFDYAFVTPFAGPGWVQERFPARA